MNKASIDEIRHRFDNDVERFSSLETGQMTTQDAAIVLDHIANCALRTTPEATRLLDLGCGAGNFALKLSQTFTFEEIALVDLSTPMLNRAVERLSAATTARLVPQAADLRKAELPAEHYDIVVAAAVLHHLRTEEEWLDVFTKIFRSLRPGGSFWIWDLVEHDIPGVQEEMWHVYGAFLALLRGEAYRDHVYAYIAHEDSPRSIPFQLAILTRAGFGAVDVVHKSGCFAALSATRNSYPRHENQVTIENY